MTSRGFEDPSVLLSKMVSTAESPADLADIFLFLADCIHDKNFVWQNSDVSSFFRGMSLAVMAFDGDSKGEFKEILANGCWRVMAEATAMGLVLD